MLLLCNLLLCGKNIYHDLINEPERTARKVYGWWSVENSNVDDFFASFSMRFDRMLPILLLLAIGLLIHLLCTMGKELAGVPLLFMGMAGTAIPVLGLENGSRITASAIFSLCAVIVFFAGDLLKESGKWVKKIGLGVFIAVGIFAIVSADHMFTFLSIQNRITLQRQEIAKEIEMRQHMGEWGYDSFAVMPEYKVIGNKSFFQQDRTAPQNTDSYYSLFLRYYDLNENTKILFTSSEFQLIKWTDKKNCVRLLMNSLKNHPYEMYRLKIMDEVTSNEEIPIVLEDTGWTEENEWIIPNKYYERKDIIFKCYGMMKDGAVEEIEYEGIIWDDNKTRII